MPDLRSKTKDIAKYIQSHQSYLAHNESLFNIYEGDLMHYVKNALESQLSGNALKSALTRVAPINVLKKVVDKLSKIYQEDPTRVIEGRFAESDKEVLAWYEENFYVNQKMNIANEFYNLSKSCLVQPYIYKNKPRLRALSPHQFLVYSDDPVDSTVPTVVIVYHGQIKTVKGDLKAWRLYSDDEFLIIDTDGNILQDEMNRFENPEGINIFGKIPFVYVNKSENLLVPKIDTDTMAMTILIPILLTDMNYVSMYSAFSVLYGIDVDDQDLSWNPSSFLRFKSKGDGETKPEIGTVKIEGDIDKMLSLTQSELAFWLNTLGIRPGAIGTLSEESFASGISKMIDEADTTEARKRQVGDFRKAESELWDLVFNYMHPQWVRFGIVETKAAVSPESTVHINYAEQVPLQTRGRVVEDQQKEVAAGFTTRKRAIKRLNPHMTEDEIDELIMEIDEERGFDVVEEPVEEPIIESGDEDDGTTEG